MANEQRDVLQEAPVLYPTVIPDHYFQPSNDSEELDMALRRCCCFECFNDQRVIDLICRRTMAQRTAVAKAYHEIFAERLIDRFERELSGNFKRVIVSLMMPLPEYYAQELYNAMGGCMGFGTKGSVLSEILCTLGNSMTKSVSANYEKKYGITLEQALSKNTYGYFRRLCISLVQGNRDESVTVNKRMAMADAITLHLAGAQRWGTDEIAFTSIMASRSYPQLRQTFLEYRKLTGHDIEAAIEGEFSGDIKRGLLTIVKYARDPNVFFADLLYQAMQGFGTDNKTLIRIIVSRSEIDLGIIKVAFMRKYKHSLKSWIQIETSGSYREALFTILG